MGSMSFTVTGEGSTAQEAFERLTSSSKTASGCEYSGEIGMKDGFVMVARQPLTMEQANKLLEDNWIDDGPRYEVGDEVRIVTWSFKSEKYLRFSGEIVAVDRDKMEVTVKTKTDKKWTGSAYDIDETISSSSTYDAALWDQLQDKWGPAGCVPLDDGRYLFFGWASS